MDYKDLLLEYLKEQYTQARQHETRQSTATNFLTAAVGVILGVVVKDAQSIGSGFWLGLLIVAIASANLLINRAHFIGNRFHTKLAGKTRRALEAALDDWPDNIARPTDLRQEALNETGLGGPGTSIGQIVYKSLQVVPVVMIVIGIVIVIMSVLPTNCHMIINLQAGNMLKCD